MNYFERTEKVNQFLGSALFEEYPLAAKLSVGYATALILLQHAGMPLKAAVRVNTNYHAFRTLKDQQYRRAVFEYHLVKSMRRESPATVLISSSVNLRFPLLLQKTCERYRTCMAINKMNLGFAKRSPVTDFIKTDHV